MTDWNLIRALISQAPISELMQVKDIIDKEIQWTRDNMAKQAQQQFAEQETLGNHKRAIPRYAEDINLRGAEVPLAVQAGCDTQAPQTMHVSESGATSSHVPLRYDLIPRSLIDRAAERYTIGAKVHTERGYQRGLADREFILNRINHIYEHLDKLFHPDYRKADNPDDEEGITRKSIDDNLGAILWGVGFICEVADHQLGWEIIRKLRDEGRVKTHSD